MDQASLSGSDYRSSGSTAEKGWFEINIPLPNGVGDAAGGSQDQPRVLDCSTTTASEIKEYSKIPWVKLKTSKETSGPWRPLPEQDGDYTRVLTVDTAQDSYMPLNCHFYLTALQQPCNYQALSYAWGTEDATEPIQVNDETVFITPTLKAALVKVREHCSKGQLGAILWIDAICINQYDGLEKSKQVMLMAQVYSKAESVLVWLDGLHSNPSETQMISKMLAETDKRGDDSDPVFVKEFNWRVHGKRVTHDVLTTKPWFQRRWVVQEALMARTCQVLHGDLIIPFSTLMGALGRAPDLPPWWHWKNRWSTLKITLLSNLILFSETQCSDERDRIYALRGIGNDGDSFPVDYAAATERVYVELAAQYACSTMLATLLVCAVAFRKHERGLNGNQRRLPSWVPDWSSKWSPPLFDLARWTAPTFRAGVEGFTCRLPSLPQIVFSENAGDAKLILKAWTGTRCSHDKSRSTCLSCVFHQWMTPHSIYHTNNECLSAHVREGILETPDTFCLLDEDSNVLFALKSRPLDLHNSSLIYPASVRYELLYFLELGYASMDTRARNSTGGTTVRICPLHDIEPFEYLYLSMKISTICII